jgi:hypothetical protein
MFTIKVNNKHSMQKSGKEQAKKTVTDLYQAVQVIKKLTG